jgi:hypothetical protein
MSNTICEERLELLQTIATDVLGIEKLESAGKPTADFCIVNVEHLALALEAAYDAGLLVGRRVARGGDEDAQSLNEVFFP